jgi:uncharacterized protein
MPKIAELIVYPVKSCAGVSVDEVAVVSTGFEFDRNWMVVDDSGTFVTQREYPKLALVKPQFGNGGLILNAPDMEPLHVPANGGSESLAISLFGEALPALSTNATADAWFSKYLGGQFRLAKCDPATLRKGGVQYPERDEAPTSFVDNYGVLVVSEASHAALNQKLSEAVPMNRFRPNIIVSGVEEHEEDYFTNARCGEVALRFINPCYRCSMTSIDQKLGAPGLEVLPALTTYRYDDAVKGVKFGNYAAVSGGVGERLHVNSDLDVDWNF